MSSSDRARSARRGAVGEQQLLFDGDVTPEADDIGYRGPTACAAAGITYRQLDYWARTGLVEPSIRPAAGSGSQRLYGFRDILVLKVVKRLLDTGISLQQIRTAVAHLRERGSADLAQVTGPRFPTCFGNALANEFNSLGSGAGANMGAPHVAPLTSLPEIGGVRAVGVELTLTATFAGQSAAVQLGFVLVGGGRIESTLVTFAGDSNFPLATTRAMTATLERHIVQLGAGTGA